MAEAREAKRAAVRVATRAAEADASLAQGIAAATSAGDAAEAKILGSFYDLQLPDVQRVHMLCILMHMHMPRTKRPLSPTSSASGALRRAEQAVFRASQNVNEMG